jgi:hypothetical protein
MMRQKGHHAPNASLWVKDRRGCNLETRVSETNASASSFVQRILKKTPLTKKTEPFSSFFLKKFLRELLAVVDTT